MRQDILQLLFLNNGVYILCVKTNIHNLLDGLFVEFKKCRENYVAKESKTSISYGSTSTHLKGNVVSNSFLSVSLDYI